VTLSKEIFVYYQYIIKYGLFLRGGKYVLKSTQIYPKMFWVYFMRNMHGETTLK
jgi:hypothetical protein